MQPCFHIQLLPYACRFRQSLLILNNKTGPWWINEDQPCRGCQCSRTLNTGTYTETTCLNLVQRGPELTCMLCGAGENGLRAALETAHLFMQEPTWTQAALDRAKQRWMATHRSNQLSLERGTTERIFRSMFKMER